MATEEDKPDSWKKSFADSAELRLVMGLLRRKVSAPNGDKQKKDASKKARRKKVRPGFLFVVSAILVVIFIGYYGTRDFGKLYDASTPVKKDNIHPYAIKKDLDKAATKRSDAISLRREEPEIQKHSSTKDDDVRPGSPEKSRNLTQGSDIIPKKNSLAVEETFARTVSHNGIKGSYKKVLDPGERVLSYPYSLYLGSWRSLDEAKKKVLSYKKKGLSPYWTEVHLGEAGIWFRVFAGCFKGPEQAKRFREEHQLEKATIRKTRYANFIGAYSHATNLENHIQSLRLFGYSPYVIKDPEGKSRLFVGAFLTKAGAERQYRDLKSIGIQGDVVLR